MKTTSMIALSFVLALILPAYALQKSSTPVYEVYAISYGAVPRVACAGNLVYLAFCCGQLL